MGIGKLNGDTVNTNFLHRELDDTKYNCKVAIWQLPYDSRYGKYDTDKNKWFDAINTYNRNEIENVEKELHISLKRYKVYTKTLEYDDGSVDETSKYPSGNVVNVKKNNNWVLAKITDKSGKIVAKKCYNYASSEGRKTIYKHFTKADNTFTIVRNFSYDTTKNRSSDVVNYAYTSMESKLTDGCTLEKEYYMLNGKEVKAEKISDTEYCVRDENGNDLVFTED